MSGYFRKGLSTSSCARASDEAGLPARNDYTHTLSRISVMFLNTSSSTSSERLPGDMLNDTNAMLSTETRCNALIKGLAANL